MMKVLKLIQLLSYMMVTAQLLFYLLVYIDALKLLPIQDFIEHRKAIEPLIASRLKIIYYACLGISLLMIVLQIKEFNSLAFITSAIAFSCLLLDVLIALKGNVPINTIINSTPFEMRNDWDALRATWLNFFVYRGILSLTGIASLFVGLIFGQK
jgi:hypothetical protein